MAATVASVAYNVPKPSVKIVDHSDVPLGRQQGAQHGGLLVKRKQVAKQEPRPTTQGLVVQGKSRPNTANPGVSLVKWQPSSKSWQIPCPLCNWRSQNRRHITYYRPMFPGDSTGTRQCVQLRLNLAKNKQNTTNSTASNRNQKPEPRPKSEASSQKRQRQYGAKLLAASTGDDPEDLWQTNLASRVKVKLWLENVQVHKADLVQR